VTQSKEDPLKFGFSFELTDEQNQEFLRNPESWKAPKDALVIKPEVSPSRLVLTRQSETSRSFRVQSESAAREELKPTQRLKLPKRSPRPVISAATDAEELAMFFPYALADRLEDILVRIGNKQIDRFRNLFAAIALPIAEQKITVTPTGVSIQVRSGDEDVKGGQVFIPFDPKDIPMEDAKVLKKAIANELAILRQRLNQGIAAAARQKKQNAADASEAARRARPVAAPAPVVVEPVDATEAEPAAPAKAKPVTQPSAEAKFAQSSLNKIVAKIKGMTDSQVKRGFLIVAENKQVGSIEELIRFMDRLLDLHRQYSEKGIPKTGDAQWTAFAKYLETTKGILEQGNKSLVTARKTEVNELRKAFVNKVLNQLPNSLQAKALDEGWSTILDNLKRKFQKRAEQAVTSEALNQIIEEFAKDLRAYKKELDAAIKVASPKPRSGRPVVAALEVQGLDALEKVINKLNFDIRWRPLQYMSESIILTGLRGQLDIAEIDLRANVEIKYSSASMGGADQKSAPAFSSRPGRELPRPSVAPNNEIRTRSETRAVKDDLAKTFLNKLEQARGSSAGQARFLAALAALGAAAAIALPYILTTFDERDAGAQAALNTILTESNGEAAPHLIAALTGADNYEVARRIPDLLVSRVAEPDVLDTLRKALSQQPKRGKDPQFVFVHEAAARALGPALLALVQEAEKKQSEGDEAGAKMILADVAAAVADLGNLLKGDAASYVIRAVFTSLKQLGGHASSAIPILFEYAYSYDHSLYQAEAQAALKAILTDAKPEESAPFLIQALNESTDYQVAREVPLVLAGMGAESGVVNALRDGLFLKPADPYFIFVHQNAAIALAPAIKAAIQEAKKKRDAGDDAASKKIMSEVTAAINGLLKILNRKNISYDTDSAIQTLGDLGAYARGAIPVLFKYAYNQTESNYQREAKAALDKILKKTKAEFSAPLLIKTLEESDDPTVTVEVPRILAQMGTVPGVIRALRNGLTLRGQPFRDTHMQSALALSAALKSAGERAEKLASSDKSASDALYAEIEAAVSDLIAVLNSDAVVFVKVAVIETLGSLGFESRSAITLLMEYAYADEQRDYHRVAQKALRGLSSADVSKNPVTPKAAAPFVIAALASKDSNVVLAAIRTLATLGPIPGVVEALQNGLTSARFDVRVQSAVALGKVLPRMTRTIDPAVVNALADLASKSPKSDDSVEAAKALSRIGDAAAVVLEKLFPIAAEHDLINKLLQRLLLKIDKKLLVDPLVSALTAARDNAEAILVIDAMGQAGAKLYEDKAEPEITRLTDALSSYMTASTDSSVDEAALKALSQLTGIELTRSEVRSKPTQARSEGRNEKLITENLDQELASLLAPSVDELIQFLKEGKVSQREFFENVAVRLEQMKKRPGVTVDDAVRFLRNALHVYAESMGGTNSIDVAVVEQAILKARQIFNPGTAAEQGATVAMNLAGTETIDRLAAYAKAFAQTFPRSQNTLLVSSVSPVSRRNFLDNLERQKVDFLTIQTNAKQINPSVYVGGPDEDGAKQLPVLDDGLDLSISKPGLIILGSDHNISEKTIVTEADLELARFAAIAIKVEVAKFMAFQAPGVPVNEMLKAGLLKGVSLREQLPDLFQKVKDSNKLITVDQAMLTILQLLTTEARARAQAAQAA
ncbi:MAG: hypothetical protein KBC91_04350, partial [Candidatus Omnitrophica bacterium]|nr:hypothetical protein [Candidatus Omnitrophota bacterium]